MHCYAFACLLLLASTVSGQDGIGVGIIVGEPTGMSVKGWLTEKTAVDAAAAWSFSGHDSFQLHADYLIHYFDVVNGDSLPGGLPIYVGIGGRIGFGEMDGGDHRVTLAVRIPVGLTYLFQRAPVDLFLELVPGLGLVPDTEFDMDLALGGRFYVR